MNSNYLLCSNCFTDEGLKRDSEKLGIDVGEICPNCRSLEGRKLTRELVEYIAFRFFVKGTVLNSDFGAAPRIQFNEHQKTSINVPEWLKEDILLLERTLNVGFFQYCPRLWMIGEVEPLKALLLKEKRKEIIKRILNEYPSRTLFQNDFFYRLRKNPKHPSDFKEYDSPPQSCNGRLDSSNLSLLYCSQDLEVCIHECRVTIEDELYIATLCPTRDLKFIDLTELINVDRNEFESLDIAIHMLFFAGAHSYDISREIALAIKESGYDGLIYPSYFSTVRTGAMPYDTIYGISIRRIPTLINHAKSQIIENIGLFGKPIQEGIISVKCINRLILGRVIYDYHFGPVGFD